MMSVSAFSPPSTSCRNFRLPEDAITPRLFSSSSRLMPMPLSLTVSRRSSLLMDSRISNWSRVRPTLSSVRLR